MKSKSLLLSTLLLASLGGQAQVRIGVDALHPAAQVSPDLYGIFYEDINHAADGGLYAELIQNRSFEDDDNAPAHWACGGGAQMSLTTKGLLNKAQGHALEVRVDGRGFISNGGFWGIKAVQGRTYRLSFWAKGKLKGSMTATLGSRDGSRSYAEAKLDQPVTGKWAKYTATLTSDANDPKACLFINLDGKGTVCFDVVSLFPPTFNNRENGMRPDLASMLKALHPRFFRFPGGCFVEGQQSPDNAFRWERTIGPVETRPGHWNVNWGYRTSDGIGFHEYLQLAEDLGAKPLYVVNVGIWHGGFTPVDSLQPWIDETLNALEYANGPVTSKYGALRAQNGHPEPFNIEYLEIGNENNQPDVRQQSDNYYKRFKLFKDAVLAKYPGMHLIGNVVAWGDDDPKWESPEPVEYVDEHYYRTPGWFSANFHKYDGYDRRGPKVYVGEYAVTQGFGTIGDLNAALGEAVFMQGMERNADHVLMASYAPIFANLNRVTWRPDMIQFDADGAFGTPSYYVQKLMADNIGTRVVPVTQDNPYEDMAEERVSPAEAKFGVGTWGTHASFTLDTKDQGKTHVVSGKWEDSGNVFSQTGPEEQCMAVVGGAVTGDRRSFKVRARKDDGPEGFLVVFNYVDKNNYCWVNFGGWGNTQHAIEVVQDGQKAQIAMKPGHVEAGRWYDVELRQDGDSIYAWLDGQPVFASKLKASTEPGIFSNATLDEKTGDVIVKVTNTGKRGTTAVVDLMGYGASAASLTRLSSQSGLDENSIDDPTKVYPVQQTLSPADGKVELEVPGYSLNIVRIKK